LGKTKRTKTNPQQINKPSSQEHLCTPHNGLTLCLEMPWNIENYNIVDGRILRVEITLPLMEFLYLKIDDVKEAWVNMLGQFIANQPGIDMSWEMEPRDHNAVVTIKIAKIGDLPKFSVEEARGAIDAVDALFEGS
jgi:hypothetical protein